MPALRRYVKINLDSRSAVVVECCSMGEKKARLQPTSIKLDPALYKRAQHFKVESGKDLQEIFSEALAEYLKKRGA